MKRKITHDHNAVSAFGAILLVIMALVAWQFLAPYLNIQPPLETLGITEPEPETVTFSAYLYNHYTDTIYVTTDTLIDVDPDPRDEHETLTAYDVNYETGDNTIANSAVRILTNAPKSVFDPYTVRVYSTMVFWDHSTSQHIVYQNEITSGVSGEKVFDWQLNPSYVKLKGVLYEYTVIKVQLLDPADNILYTETWAMY